MAEQHHEILRCMDDNHDCTVPATHVPVTSWVALQVGGDKGGQVSFRSPSPAHGLPRYRGAVQCLVDTRRRSSTSDPSRYSSQEIDALHSLTTVQLLQTPSTVQNSI